MLLQVQKWVAARSVCAHMRIACKHARITASQARKTVVTCSRQKSPWPTQLRSTRWSRRKQARSTHRHSYTRKHTHTHNHTQTHMRQCARDLYWCIEVCECLWLFRLLDHLLGHPYTRASSPLLTLSFQTSGELALRFGITQKVLYHAHTRARAHMHKLTYTHESSYMCVCVFVIQCHACHD